MMSKEKKNLKECLFIKNEESMKQKIWSKNYKNFYKIDVIEFKEKS